MAATWPSIIPLGATTPAPAAAWATAIEPYRSRGASIRALTSGGGTKPAGRRLVCATSRRRAAFRRSLRGRTAGNPAAIGFLLTWAHTDPTLGAAARFTLRCCVYLPRDPYRILRRAPRRRSLGLRTGSPASIAASRIAAPWSASASTRAVTDGRGAITSTLRPDSG